jgi:hypothetical protein
VTVAILATSSQIRTTRTSIRNRAEDASLYEARLWWLGTRSVNLARAVPEQPPANRPSSLKEKAPVDARGFFY